MTNKCLKIWGIATLLNVAYRYFPETKFWDRPYGICESLSYVLFVIGGRLLTEKESANRYYVDALLGLTISNVMDEAMFNPHSLGINEPIFAIAIIIVTKYRLTKLKHVANRENR